MAERTKRSPESEAIVLWRMERASGMQACAALVPRPDGAAVVWFINDRPVGYKDFDDWTSAIGWSERLQAQNWAVGWRLAD